MFARLFLLVERNPYIAYSVREIEDKLLSDDSKEVRELFIRELCKSAELTSKLCDAMKNILFTVRLAKVEVLSFQLKADKAKYDLDNAANISDHPKESAIKLKQYLNYDQDKKNSNDFNTLENEIYHLFGEKNVKNYCSLCNNLEVFEKKIDYTTKVCLEIEHLVQKLRIEYQQSSACVIV